MLRYQLRIMAVLFTVLVATGSGVGGKKVWAGVVDSLQEGHWQQISNSNLNSVATAADPGGSLPAIINAWSGGAYDSTRSRLVIWGGGHTDYAGNELYAFDLDTDTWQRLTEPGVADTGTGCLNPDGSPRSRHTYNYLEYMPNDDVFVSFGGSGNWESGWDSFCANLHAYSFTNNSWNTSWGEVLPSDYYSADGAMVGSWVVRHPLTNDVWRRGTGGNTSLFKMDGSNRTWTRYDSDNYQSLDATAAIDYSRNILVAVGGSYLASDGYIAVWDLDNPGAGPTIPSTSGDRTLEYDNAPGFVYDSQLNLFVGWNGGADVILLDPDTWTWSRVSPSSSNSVTPTNGHSNGTYGRFRYMPDKNAYVVVNSTNQDVYVYKLSSGAGASIPTITFTATPSTLTDEGTSELAWNSSDSSVNCTGSDGWSGAKGASGTETSTLLTADTTFMLTCTLSGGLEVSQSVTVSVNISVTPAGGGEEETGSSNSLVTNTLPSNYVWSSLADGGQVFVDRSYSYNDIPAEYLNIQILQTANADNQTATSAMVTFTALEDIMVYIAHDTQISTLPSWMDSTWTDTQVVLGDNDTTRTIYSKLFSAGPVSLGSNGGNSASSMYVVMVQAASTVNEGDTGSSGSSESTVNAAESSAGAFTIDLLILFIALISIWFKNHYQNYQTLQSIHSHKNTKIKNSY